MFIGGDGKDQTEFTGPMIKDEALKFARKNELVTKVEKPARVAVEVRATRELGRLKSILAKLPSPKRFDQLLHGIGLIIDQEPQEPVRLPDPATMTEDSQTPVGASSRQGTSDGNTASDGEPQIEPDQVAAAMEAADPHDNSPEIRRPVEVNRQGCSLNS